jgi:hypothetical protein
VAQAGALELAAARVRELMLDYEPPSFDHVPDPDAALFLCAIDHRTGYRESHLVDGEGPFEGSALMWAVGLLAAERQPGLLMADRLRDITAEEIADAFRVGDETVADPAGRAALLRDVAAGLGAEYSGSAAQLLTAAGARLGGPDGLLERVVHFEAYSDPLAKKSFLFAKICERRGWLSVGDPESWEVCADNVLMRLALRSGLVAPGDLDSVRAATREACKRLALEAGVPVPVLDDLLWELGRNDPDLLGAGAGDLREPERDSTHAWY